MPDALSLREDKSFDGAREASRCSSRSRHGWTTAVSSMKRDTMSTTGGSALSADRSAPNIGLFVFIRVPDVLTIYLWCEVIFEPSCDVRDARTDTKKSRIWQDYLETPVTILPGNLEWCGHVRHNRTGCVWTYGMRTIKLG
ncbi:hypothetical protein ALC60_01965 [Trachymyrmex zeteki]|uniref:Uncharacterized protein n=1 Tax=Mycetomoellerius zeteki TaxID=64791 RepID=A0A151XF75_9HYME|nr:hypothetical protein ALC60_01965 [Trachymyrmex zeteki]